MEYLPRGRSVTQAHIQSHAIRMLLIGNCCRHKLSVFDISFGVDELLELSNLQAPVVVGNDLEHHDQFARYIQPECGFCLAGDLDRTNGKFSAQYWP